MTNYCFPMTHIWQRRTTGAPVTNATSSAPFGYRFFAAGNLGEDSTEQAILRRARELRDQNASFRQILATLRSEGREPKRGNVWYLIAMRTRLHQRAAPALCLGAPLDATGAQSRARGRRDVRLSGGRLGSRMSGSVDLPNGAA